MVGTTGGRVENGMLPRSKSRAVGGQADGMGVSKGLGRAAGVEGTGAHAAEATENDGDIGDWGKETRGLPNSAAAPSAKVRA